MRIYPAIDIKDGKCVRLFKGDYDKVTVYGDNPVQMAKKWENEGGEFIHVVDLARAHVLTVKKLEQKSGLIIANIGTGTGYSVLDMVNAFSKAVGKDIPYEIVDRRPGDIASCYADPSYAKELLGFVAEKTLDDMCRDSWNWQKSNPNGYPDDEE